MTAPVEKIRSGLLLRTCLEVLRDRGRLPGRDVVAEIARRVDLTPYERELNRSGVPRWETDVRFHSGNAASVGWLVKQDNLWQITDAGLAALGRNPTPEALLAEVGRGYREIYNSRKKAREKHGGKLDLLAAALDLVPAGSWTAHEDLAELIGGTADEVAHLLADGKALPTAYRVLTGDGEIPPAGQLNFAYRGVDLRSRLVGEGVEFQGNRANQAQRVPAETLRAVLAEDATARRAWLVRGSNVEGMDLVPAWLAEGFVSLAAAHLPPDIDPELSDAALRQVVDAAYGHKGYSVRERLVGEFAGFLRKMRLNDVVLTTRAGQFYVGVVDGPPIFVDSSDRRSNLRRAVHWLNPHTVRPRRAAGPAADPRTEPRRRR